MSREPWTAESVLLDALIAGEGAHKGSIYAEQNPSLKKALAIVRMHEMLVDAIEDTNAWLNRTGRNGTAHQLQLADLLTRAKALEDET